MRFFNINIEGPDCSGKTTLYNQLHKKTNFKYNIQDRSCMSMFVYAKMYEREDASLWFDKILDDLKRLDTLYILLLPSESTILDRLEKRGDEFQDKDSILKVRSYFRNIAKMGFGSYPNVLVLEEDDLDRNINKLLQFINSLNEMPGQELIKSLVLNSGRNELVDVQCKEVVDKNQLDLTVLDFPQEKEYYEKIEFEFFNKIFREFTGLNEYNQAQKHDSRRFVYTDDSCISIIHVLWRQNKLNVSATLRSSNVSKTLWADYEFLKILSVKTAKEMSLPEDCAINLTVSIRSAHIIP
jgi:thymidylate kinase